MKPEAPVRRIRIIETVRAASVDSTVSVKMIGLERSDTALSEELWSWCGATAGACAQIGQVCAND
jgi:hypothetical protein